MSDQDNDLLIADLLGEAPKTPDPGFRYDVLVHVATHARRRHALNRALNQVALFSGIGMIFPVLAAFGVTWRSAEPVAMAVGVVALGLLFATLMLQGPRTVLARSRHALAGWTK